MQVPQPSFSLSLHAAGFGFSEALDPKRKRKLSPLPPNPTWVSKKTKKPSPLLSKPMDQFRRGEDKDDDPRSSAFSPPSIIRESSSFSKPILPSSSSLLSPKPHFRAPPAAAAAAAAAPSSNGTAAAIGSAAAPHPPTARYRECLRNHAASLGGHVIDGCGEFMPAGPADSLKCAACGCHRSFHRKELPEPDNDKLSYRVPLLLPPSAPPHPNPLRFSGNTTDQSSSEERNTNNNNASKINFPGHCSPVSGGEGSRKKRFRTKFSSEQKEKMKAFAERVGWRVQKKDEGEMERFCGEVGVSRRVLKVWMHNNKHLIKKQEEEERAVKVEENHHHQQQQQLEVDGV